jgi:hypothetical protein
MSAEIFENYAVFLMPEDKSINGTAAEFAAACPDWAGEHNNHGCGNCKRCNNCKGCALQERTGDAEEQ